MRIAKEEFTVLPDAGTREVSVLLAGLRITLSFDEAQGLAKALEGAVKRIAKDPVEVRPAGSESDPDIDGEKVLRGLRTLMTEKTGDASRAPSVRPL
jgi:hypothetical protein